VKPVVLTSYRPRRTRQVAKRSCTSGQGSAFVTIEFFKLLGSRQGEDPSAAFVERSRRSAVSTNSDMVRPSRRGLTFEFGHDGIVNIEGRLHMAESSYDVVYMASEHPQRHTERTRGFSLAARGLPALWENGLIGMLACTRFRRHRVRCFYGTGGESWRDGSLPGSSSLRRCG
jgi:hypothetical protein